MATFFGDLAFAHRGGQAPDWLFTFDSMVTWAFAVEISMRVLTYRPPLLDVFKGTYQWTVRRQIQDRLRYFFTPLLLLDFLAVISLLPVLRGLRALRLLRLVRTSKFLHHSSPLLSLLRAFQENAALYLFTFGFLLFVIIVGGLSIFLVEKPVNPQIGSVADGVWWALVTVTTVGYGDVAPQTGLGRAIGGTVMVLGMFTLALFAGVAGSTLLRALSKLREDQFGMSSFTNHVIICGYEPTMPVVLETVLEELDHHQTELVVFGKGERPPQLPAEFLWVSGDPTKESELNKVRIVYAKAVVLIGSRLVSPQHADATVILTAFTIRAYLAKSELAKARKVPLHIVAEILDHENVEHARTAGVNDVIESTRIAFSLMAHSVLAPGSGAVVSQVTSAKAHSFYLMPNPLGKTTDFGELTSWLRQRHPMIPLGFRDAKTGQIEMCPADDTSVPSSAQVVYLSREAI
jgi:voltage-gated potassium channel